MTLILSLICTVLVAFTLVKVLDFTRPDKSTIWQSIVSIFRYYMHKQALQLFEELENMRGLIFIKLMANPGIKEDAIRRMPEQIEAITQTPELCELAVSRQGSVIALIKPEFQTDALCILSVSQDGYNLRYIENQTIEICRAALASTPRCYKIIKLVKSGSTKECLEKLDLLERKNSLKKKMSQSF